MSIKLRHGIPRGACLAAFTLVLVASRAVGGDSKSVANATAIAQFQLRVMEYYKVHEKVRSELPLKPTNSSEKLGSVEEQFAAKIRAGRGPAQQGDVFVAPVAAEFRRLIALTMRGSSARRIRLSLKHAEPVQGALKVNDAYPPYIPLQSTPPTLLLNLPRLPQGLDYRVVGTNLVLRDAAANLIIDFLPNAIH